MAEASLFVLDLPDEIYRANTEPMLSHINVGTGEDIAIGDLAMLVAGVVGYERRISFDTSKPDGPPRKLMDVSRLSRMGWRASTPLEEGVRATYRWFVENHANLREA